MPQMEYEIERRSRVRKTANACVYISCPGCRFQACRTRNLSAYGVYVEIGRLPVSRGVSVDLIFVLPAGRVLRIHRRRARVSHVSRTGVGLMLYRNDYAAERRDPIL